VTESFPELMGAAEVAELLGVSRQRVNQLAQGGDFPRPVAVLHAGRIWRGEDVRAWKVERQLR
jgi:predicted DNA-binding transcriptional regulator AlpA